MGWAVVILTAFLRLILLPLSIISQRDAIRQQEAEEKASESMKLFKNDPVAQKEEFRKIIRQNRISPWAKVITIVIQLLVLILLYQVFIGGIFSEKLVSMLYSSISFPGVINNNFFGTEIGLSHSIIWPSIVAAYLFIGIFIKKITDKTWESSEAIFLVLFPLFTFAILWILPVAKALFILTSLIFSDILNLSIKIFSGQTNKKI